MGSARTLAAGPNFGQVRPIVRSVVVWPANRPCFEHRRAASGARRPAARALRVGSSSTKMVVSTSPAEELAAEKMLSSKAMSTPTRVCRLQGRCFLSYQSKFAAEHLRHHLEQLACGSTVQPLEGKKEGSGIMGRRTEENRKKSYACKSNIARSSSTFFKPCDVAKHENLRVEDRYL